MEFSAGVASFILFEVYECYRFWAFSIDMVGDIPALDLRRVLGSKCNAAKMLALLEVIESTNFLSLSSTCRLRGEHESSSTGQRGPVAEWFLLQPLGAPYGKCGRCTYLVQDDAGIDSRWTARCEGPQRGVGCLGGK